MEIKIHCKYDELVDPKKLKVYKRNRNKHPQSQIDRLVKLYEFHGVRHPIIVDKERMVIAAGHGRRLAAIEADIKYFPVVYQNFESEEALYTFVQSDNAATMESELDIDSIKFDVSELNIFNLDSLGIPDFSIDGHTAGSGDGQSDSERYTKEIKIPIYEPKGLQPKINQLFDLNKMKELVLEIKSSDLPEDEKEFLMLVAQRHIIFNYNLIAEYYCHASPNVQNFMEKSALVIIDMNKAIENGFVSMSNEIAELYKENLDI